MGAEAFQASCRRRRLAKPCFACYRTQAYLTPNSDQLTIEQIMVFDSMLFAECKLPSSLKREIDFVQLLRDMGNGGKSTKHQGAGMGTPSPISGVFSGVDC